MSRTCGRNDKCVQNVCRETRSEEPLGTTRCKGANNNKILLGSEALTAVTMKTTVFWVCNAV
jgi:hypothetical protein